MGAQKNSDNITEKDTDILDSDDLIDLDMALDALSTSPLPTQEKANLSQTRTSELLDESLSDALEDLEHSDYTINHVLEENLSETMPEHIAATEAQQAAEQATQVSSAAEAIAKAEAQTAADAMTAAKQAMAAAEAAEQAANEAKLAAQAKAEAKTKALEEAQTALEAETKAREEAEAKAREKAETKAREEAETKAREEAETKAREEAEAKAKEDAETKAREEAEAKAKEDAETKAREEAEAKAREEAETKAREEAETKAREEAETKAREEAETKAREKAETKAREEAETKARKEAEAKEEAETKARDTSEMEESFASIDADDFFSSNNIDTDELTLNDDLALLSDPVSSLEQEIDELTDLNEVDDTAPNTTNETTHLQTPLDNNTASTESSQANNTEKTKEQPMTEHKKSGFNIANSIMISIGLIAVIIAALALWMSLDASQKTTSLASEPAKLQQKIDQLEQHQEKQTLLLQQQIENLQHQLKILTNVISNKKTQQWQENLEQPNTSTSSPAAITTQQMKPIIIPIKKNTATIEAPNQHKTPRIKTTHAIAEKTIVRKKTKAAATTKSAAKITNKTQPTSPNAVSPESVQGWVVYLFSSKSEQSAQRETKQFRKKGLDAKYIRTISKGVPWYHVLVSGFETERKAAAYKRFVKEYHGADAWYNKSANEIKTLKLKKNTDSKKTMTIKATKPANKSIATRTTPATVSSTHSFRFSAIKSDVWLQISAPNTAKTGKGKLLKEVLLKPGHHVTIKAAAESLWITTGNAPALSIRVDGAVAASQGSLGNGKKVLRNYRFNIK